MRNAPLRMKPFRITSWERNEPEFTATKFAAEDYSWKGRLIKASQLSNLPLFWSLELAAATFGWTPKQYIESGLASVPLRFANRTVHVPKAIIWAEVSLGGGPNTLFLKPIIDQLAADLRKARIFAGPISITPEGANLTIFDAGPPNDDTVDAVDPPDGARVVRQISSRRCLGGHILYLCLTQANDNFTYTLDDGFGNFVPRSQLIAKHAAFLNAAVPLHESVKWYSVVSGASGQVQGNISSVLAQTSKTEVNYVGDITDPVIGVPIQAVIRDFFNL